MNRNDKLEHRHLKGMLPGNAQIQAIFILVIILIIALVTVTNVMMGDYTNLFIGLGVAGVILYIGTLWRYSWLLAILLGTLAFAIAPTSFWIPADFMCYGLVDGMAIALLMRRALGSPAPPAVVTPGLSTKPMVVCLAIYVLYVWLHGMIGEISPVYPGQYSLRNTVKAYAEDTMPATALILLIILRYRLPPLSQLTKFITPTLTVSMLLLAAHRGYQISKGHYEGDETTDYFGVLIPVINLIPNEFALRIASPLAALWAASRLFSPHEKLSKFQLILNLLLLLLAIGGAVMSSGRATPAMVVLCVCFMAFLSRRFGFLAVSTAAFVLFVAAVNVAGPAIDRLPFAIRRSVAELRFTQSGDKDSISGSTNMREFLVEEGMKELKSNNRVFFTGRGVLQFTAGDSRINEGDEEYEKWMLAVRTGRLHRTSASQLIRYGIVGTTLYYLAQLSILLYCWKALRVFRRQQLPEAQVAAFALAVMAMNTSLGFIQDGPFTTLSAWLVALVIGLSVKRGIPLRAAVTVPAEPARHPSQRPMAVAGRST